VIARMNDPNDDSVNDESQLPPEHLAEAEAVPRLPPGNALERGTKCKGFIACHHHLQLCWPSLAIIIALLHIPFFMSGRSREW
jgi:hypothetical protein